MKQNMKDLVFEVEAVPQVNNRSNTASSTPLNVKIRIRNNGQNKPVRQGIISIPKMGGQEYPCEKIRLSSSDQTIMSFNVIMEDDKSVRQSMQKKKRIFHMFKRGGCFGIQSDDDESEEVYLKRQSFELMTTLSTNAMDKQTFNLTKNLSSLETSRTNKITQKDFLGKCKPGGCLDPPFGEDKYSYIPKLIDISESTKDLSKLEKNEDQDKTSLKNKIKVMTEDKSGYNADFKKDNINSTSPVGNNIINIKESNSIITYPSTSSSTELFISDEIHNKFKKGRKTKETKLSNLSNEFKETYYISPKKAKKTNNLEESNGNIAKYNKEKISSKILLSQLHLNVQEATNDIAQSDVQKMSTRGGAVEEMPPILNVSKIMLDDQVERGTDLNTLSSTNLSQPNCGSYKNIKNIEATICHEGNSNNLLNYTVIPTIPDDTASRGPDSNISSIINATSNNSYLTLLNKDKNDTIQLDYDTKRLFKDIKSLSIDQNQSINSNLRNMIEFQSDILKKQDNHYKCDSIESATNELICGINKSQSKNSENYFKTIAPVSSTTEIIEIKVLPKSNDGTENKNIDISDTRKINSVTTFICQKDKIAISKIENERSNDISLQPKMEDKFDSNIKDNKVSLNKLNTADSKIIHLEKNSNDLLTYPVTTDHKVNIEKQKELFSPGCNSEKQQLEKQIETDTANNNSFTRISNKEKLHNSITPQTKLDDEVKSINESILFNNIDEEYSTSVKDTTLITDNVQNISDQAIQNVIKSDANRNNLNSKSDLSLNQNNLLPANETTLTTDNFRNINEQDIQNITISKGDRDQTNSESALPLNKSNLYPTKENTLFPNHIQDIRDQAIQNISMSQANGKQINSLSYLPKNESDFTFTKKTNLGTSSLQAVEDQVIQNKRQTRDQIDLILNESNATPTKETTLDSNNIQDISDKIIQNIKTLKANRSPTDFISDLPQNHSDLIPTRESTLVYDNIQNNSDQAIQSIPTLQANRNQINSKSDLKVSNLTLTKETILISNSSQYISDQTSQSIKISKLNRDQINSKSDLPQNKNNLTPTIDTTFDNGDFQKICDQAIQNITISQSNRNQIQSDLSPNESQLISPRKPTLVEGNIQNIRDQIIKKIHSKSNLSLNKSSLTSTKETTLVESNAQNIRDESIQNVKNDLSLNESNLTSTGETTLVNGNIQNISDYSVQIITKSNENMNQMYPSSELSLNEGSLSLAKALVKNDIQNTSDRTIKDIAQSQTKRNQIDSNRDLYIDKPSLIFTSLNAVDEIQRKTVGTKENSPKIKLKTSFKEENGEIISLKETSLNNLKEAIEVQLKNNVSATNEYKHNIKQSTHKKNIVKDIYLDLMFQSYAVDKNKKVVRTLDTSLSDNGHRLPGDNILQLKTLIRMDGNEIRIPIDADNDLCLKITKRQEKFSYKNQMNSDLLDPLNLSSKQKSDKIGVFLKNKRNDKNLKNANVSTKIKDKTKSAENLQETLCSIYQDKLLPLHDIIRNLIGDVDRLAQQQSNIIDKLYKVNEIQVQESPNKNKNKYGCNSNYNYIYQGI